MLQPDLIDDRRKSLLPQALQRSCKLHHAHLLVSKLAAEDKALYHLLNKINYLKFYKLFQRFSTYLVGSSNQLLLLNF